MREVMIEAVKFLLQQAKSSPQPKVHHRAAELLEQVEAAEAAGVVEQAETVAAIRSKSEKKKPE